MYSWMKMYEFRLRFHWSLCVFLRFKLTIFHHWLVHRMAWWRPSDKALSETVMVSLLTHLCVTQPQWVKTFCYLSCWLIIPCTLGQHYGCWCPGSLHHQAISSHGIAIKDRVLEFVCRSVITVSAALSRGLFQAFYCLRLMMCVLISEVFW